MGERIPEGWRGKKQGAIPSNSSKGNAYDNALMESFYKTRKREVVKNAGFKTVFRQAEIPQKIVQKYPSCHGYFYLVLLPHEGMFHPVAFALKQENVAMVGKSVDHCGSHLWLSVKIVPHFENSRLVVRMILLRSYESAMILKRSWAPWRSTGT